MRCLGMIAVVASCTHPMGPGVEAPVGSANAHPDADGTTLTLLGTGAEPRRILRYATSWSAADLTLQWSADEYYEVVGSHPAVEHTTIHLPRTIHGSLVAMGSGRARLELAQGTLDASDVGPGVTLGSLEVEGSAFTADLPIDLGVELRADAIDPDPVHVDDTGFHYLVATYSNAVLTAIPSRLPSVPVGVGARWQIDTRRDGLWWRTTWSIDSFDGSRIHLTAMQSMGLPPSPGWASSAFYTTDIHTSLDLATLAVDATTALAEWGEGDNFEAHSTSRQHAKATVTIAPAGARAPGP